MILIADGGSTGVKWCLLNDGEEISRFVTTGINPAHLSGQEIAGRVADEVVPALGVAPQFITSIFYYGAGCRPGPLSDAMADAIASVFVNAEIEVASDLLGAARALCGDNPGIACILGTGSNSCLYDGRRIVANVSPLGYILGDEGSGAVLGRNLVADVLKHQLPDDLCREFLDIYNLDVDSVIQAVYRRPEPNRFLASFTPFLKAHVDRPEIRRLLLNTFRSFFVRNLKGYEGYGTVAANFVGSIALHFSDLLAEAAHIEGCPMGITLRDPLDGLVIYHKNH